jgi:hypothetical protein
VRRCAHRQMFLNRVDQLRNTDGLRKKGVPLDIETSFCFGSGHQRREKYDWRVSQFGVGLDSCRYFASVGLWHRDIKQDYVRSETARTLMSLGSVVFFEHEIVTSPFEKNFDQVSDVTIVIDNQDASLSRNSRDAN